MGAVHIKITVKSLKTIGCCYIKTDSNLIPNFNFDAEGKHDKWDELVLKLISAV